MSDSIGLITQGSSSSSFTIQIESIHAASTETVVNTPFNAFAAMVNLTTSLDNAYVVATISFILSRNTSILLDYFIGSELVSNGVSASFNNSTLSITNPRYTNHLKTIYTLSWFINS